jgi:hypothetical protein
LFDSNDDIPHGGRITLPASKMATGQMTHPDTCLIIKLAYIYRYLRLPMQMLFSGNGLFSVKQIFRPKISWIYGKN